MLCHLPKKTGCNSSLFYQRGEFGFQSPFSQPLHFLFTSLFRDIDFPPQTDVLSYLLLAF